jgi:hypothetical protein
MNLTVDSFSRVKGGIVIGFPRNHNDRGLFCNQAFA